MPTKRVWRRERSAITSCVRWMLAAMLFVACTASVQSRAPRPPTEPEIPGLPEGEPLKPGAYALVLDRYRITLTVPAGWEGWAFGVLPTREGPGPPAGRGIGLWIVDNIYADPCRWDRGLLEPPPGPSADALAAALKAQWGRYATPPTTGDLNGTPVIEMDLTVPPDIRLSDCARERGNAYFLYWPQRGGGGRYAQGPGQREHLWILELEGARLVVGASYFPETPASGREELWDIAASVQVSGA